MPEQESLPMETILVVDVRASRKGLRDLLTAEGYQVDFASSGSSLRSVMVSECPAAVLLEWHQGSPLPWTACAAIRKTSMNTPLIVLGSRTQAKQKVQLFDMGADDYVEEPFDAVELVVRLRSAIRRSKLQRQSAQG
jgi:DNA-binding response OmpR family regulator